MKRLATLILLVWSALFQNVVDPLVHRAERALTGARQEAEDLETRWEALGMASPVVEPVDGIVEISELTLDMPEQMLEDFSLIVGAEGDLLEVVEDVVQEAAGAIGNDVLRSRYEDTE